jgi:hypothetical protein
MQQLLENSKALKEEHMAEVSKLNTIEVNKANIANQTEADKSAWGSEGYRTKADEAAHGPGGYATRGQIEVNEKQGEMQIKVAQAAAGIAATAKGRETAAELARIDSLGLTPEEAKRAKVALLTRVDLFGSKTTSKDMATLLRIAGTAVENDPKNEGKTAAEKLMLTKQGALLLAGEALSDGAGIPQPLDQGYIDAGKSVGTLPPEPTLLPSHRAPTAPRGVLSLPTSSDTPHILNETTRGLLGGIAGGAGEVFSKSSASELGRNAKENIKRWTGNK